MPNVYSCALLTMILAVRFAAPEQSEQHRHDPPRDGAVHFATSCRASVSQDFDRAVARLHSFWFSAAIESFEAVLVKDPACAMAYWGVAMSRWGNPYGGFRSAAAIKEARAALERANAAGAATPRERAYIAAVALLYADAETVDLRTRTAAYERAMAELASAYPDDSEARIFYALALGQTASPTDKTYANQLKAADILEAELARQPKHPGIAHYIIHSYDVPPLASRALKAAKAYAALAPDAPHALHMPSHTFTRVGLWQESIDTNLASAAVARREKAPAAELHALDYQVYAYLQTGQDARVRRLLPEIPTIGSRIDINDPGAASPPNAGFFAVAAIPARYALERNAWSDAASLPVSPSPFPWTEALTHFARGLGAIRSGNRAAAVESAAKLAEYRDVLRQRKDSYDWAGQAEIQHRAVSAWIARFDGQLEQALVLARQAAEMEDATEKASVTPGPLKPARELLAEMLLEEKRPADALEAFEATLRVEANRFRALYGAARAAALAGDGEKSRRYYQALLKACARADKPERPELREARAAVRR